MKRIIGVIGQGFVGGAMTQVMSRYYDVWVHDKAGKVASGGQIPFAPGRGSRRVESATELLAALESSDAYMGVVFLCLPTPMRRSGECDISIVQGVLDELARAPAFEGQRAVPLPRIAVVKSTVPPGTCEAWNEQYASTPLRVVFNPEFLTEANALRDFEQQDRIIVGGPRPYTDVVKQVYEAAFAGVPIIKTSSTIAETVKYMTNAFLSVKVAFANEMRQVCDAVGADYDKVVEYTKHDRRLGSSHWSVPGPDGARGFGGHCFPKDLNALMYLAGSHGVLTPVMAGAWKKNLEVRSQDDRDWEGMVGRAVTID